ncbi:MerR family transcriptional regulator [Paenibacillaceae bacterium]|nr:MerR family transcriptional regulator [Paenibacillaceae bacterium]
MKGDDEMTRGELAKRTGLSMATIRYYEDTGVLPAPSRGANGYRIYTDDYLVKIKFIIAAKSLGYSLKEIQETLELLNKETRAEVLEEIVRNKIVEIEQNISKLRMLQALLAGLLETEKEEIENYMGTFRSPET